MAGIILGTLVALAIIFLALAVKFVKPNEIGYVYTFNRPKRSAKTGIVIVIPFISDLIKFPKEIQTIPLVPEDVVIAAEKGFEEESQPVYVMVTQLFSINEINKIYRELGVRSLEQLTRKLFGKQIVVKIDNQEPGQGGLEEERWKGGLAGEMIAAVILEYVASSEVKTLDDALRMRTKLGNKIFDKLQSELPPLFYGIEWKPAIVVDVVPRPEIIAARRKKAEAAVARDTTNIKAQEVVIQAEVDAQSIVLKGDADAKAEEAKGLIKVQLDKAAGLAGAEVDLAKGEAQAKVELAKLNAKLQIVKNTEQITSLADASKILAFLLFGSDIVGQLKGLGELKFFMAPDLSSILEKIFGSSKSISSQEIIKFVMTLSDQQKKKLKQQIGQIL